MSTQLALSIGQHSERGRKDSNQDFFAARVPDEPLLSMKGVCVAVADGVSSSTVSHIASETAIKAFLEDYYCTSEAWSVRTAAERVLTATNSWLYAQTRHSDFRYDSERGYACTFSAVIVKSTTAHVIHAGDARVYSVQGTRLERLTTDHRIRESEEASYLSRALGAFPQLEVDYRAVPVAVGTTFVLLTDGVHEHISESLLVETLGQHEGDLDAAARTIARAAFEAGSDDNLTVQIARVTQLPPAAPLTQVLDGMPELPLPGLLRAGDQLDGYEIVRALHSSHRSHVYRAIDQESRAPVAIKIPALDLREDPAALERFLLEEWISRRIDSAHVLKSPRQTRTRTHAYLVTEYLEGQSLAQWMVDHPQPSVEAVRGIIEQLAKGLQAFHRQDMLHQDIRPENVWIDASGTVKVIDFGSVQVAGLAEINSSIDQPHLLGTAQYTAPEYFLGELGTRASDVYSVGVVAYQMLCGRLPYGDRVPQARTRAAQARLVYRSVLSDEREIPAWLDDTLRRAVHRSPQRRYSELSELVYDLRHPNPSFLAQSRRPLLERDPVTFWKWVSAVLAAALAALLLQRCESLFGLGVHAPPPAQTGTSAPTTPA